jgi:hypothetical protein
MRMGSTGKMYRLICAFLIGLLAGPALGQESVYTDLDLDACTSINPSSEDEPGGFASLRCKGLGDLPVYFKEFDLRQSAYFGSVSPRIIDEAGETFSTFNHVGNKVEWRLGADGRPYAAILRWFIENSDPATGMPDKAFWGQVLVVSKVAADQDGMGCVTGYVDALANPEPNLLARQVADDVARGFNCGVDRATYHGERGEKAGEPSYSFPTP